MKKYRILFLAFLLIPLLSIQEAYMSQVFNRPLTLEDCINKSDIIVIAKPSNPLIHQEQITFENEKKQIPPFTKLTYHFEVVDQISNTTQKSFSSNQKIEVNEYNWESRLDLHKQYYLEDISESPFESIYTSTIDLNKAQEPLYLFLKLDDKGQLRFVANSSYESLSKKNEIETLIEKKK